MNNTADLGTLARLLGERGDPRGEEVVRLVSACSDAVLLRHFAVACASHAVVATNMSNLDKQTLKDALFFAGALDYRAAVVATPPDVAEQAQQAAKRVAQELENRADAIMEGVPEDAEPPPEYHIAWRRTRAAESVVQCFEPAPADAANRACYEAYYATKDVGPLLILAKWALRSEMKLPWM